MAFGFLKKAIKGIGKGVKAVGKVAHKAAPALAFIPGVGTVAAAGIGALGGLASGKGLGGAFSGALKGATGGLVKSGLSKLGGLAASKLTGGAAGGGGEFGPGFADPGAGGGFDIGSLLGKGKDLLLGGGGKNLAGLALGGMSLKASSDQRKSSEAFNQKLLDIQMANLARAEGEFDRKAPLREGGQTALLEAITRQTGGTDSFSEFLKSSKKRKPGEFSVRAA